MTKSTDELRGVISSWRTISSAWKDKKSKYVEENVISELEYALQDLEEQIEGMVFFAKRTEERIEEIERTGGNYGW